MILFYDIYVNIEFGNILSYCCICDMKLKNNFLFIFKIDIGYIYLYVNL